MNRFNIFVIRAIVGAVFAVVLMRFFHPQAHPVYIAGLGIFMVGMSYFFNYLRKKKSR